ncbi:MAG: cytochrome-c peroxidase [Burkholderiales bacterium]|nr:cytochrome-c peroxidase [Burkholderiales bacterium]
MMNAMRESRWALGVAMCGVIAGCGGGGSDTPAASAAAATAAPVTAPAPATAAPVTPVLSAAASALLALDLGNLFNYAAPALPAYYDAAVAATDNTPAANRATNAAATLGRVLFYDRKLSVNSTIACASCHQQALGFSDSARFSAGFAGGATTAHSMRLGNVRYWQPGNMFWDRRAASVEAQATQPIQHPVEMGFDAGNGGIAALLARMQALPYYPELFTFAFGDTAITEVRIQLALAQFERAMVSTGSRWDQGYAQTFNPALPDKGLDTAVPTLTAQENRGRHLFVANAAQGGLACAACHVPPTFALAANSRSNGLDAGETTVFKSPSLKSVGLATAFMHDGRFSSLEQVVEHYNSGVQAGPALDNRLRGGGGNGAPRGLNLPADDKAALVAFLRSLSDASLAADAKFSSPFRPGLQ